MAMGPYVWMFLRACGVPWAPHPWHPVPPIHACTPSSLCSALRGMPTHPVCIMPGFVAQGDGQGTVGTPPGCARQQRGLAGAAPLTGVTWGQPVASASLLWLCFPCWKSHPGVAVPVNATVVIVPVSATGNLCSPQQPAPTH